MFPVRGKGRSAAEAWVALPSPVLFFVLFAGVALGHATLLHLPYFWDEGGYYVPAALAFYRHGRLIPEFTNAHPPLPNIVIGCVWKMFGFHIIVTRLLACAIAGAALLAVLRLAECFIPSGAALAVCLLTGVYSIWYAQSSLVHADLFAACCTLWGLLAFFRLPGHDQAACDGAARANRRALARVAIWFTLAALAKETAIVQPVALAGLEAVRALRSWHNPAGRSRAGTLHAHRALALSVPVVPLACWFLYHRWRTGFTFGNPEFLRYNATANFTSEHIAIAFRYRFVHLFWQRDIWVPLLLAVLCITWRTTRPLRDRFGLPPEVLQGIAVLVTANFIAFSALGGALLTRYLLPVYPLLLLVCVAVWVKRTRSWFGFAALTGVLFIASWWVNPPTFFAPEDNLTYRDMILVHENAIRFVSTHYPEASVLTAWPVAADLQRPELGYAERPFRVTAIDNFTTEQVRRAALEAGAFDTAIVFSTQFVPPALQEYLETHPGSRRAIKYNATRDLSPVEVARLLVGTIVWHENRGGEWAAVLRFPRSYEAQWQGAQLQVPARTVSFSRFAKSSASKDLP